MPSTLLVPVMGFSSTEWSPDCKDRAGEPRESAATPVQGPRDYFVNSDRSMASPIAL